MGERMERRGRRGRVKGKIRGGNNRKSNGEKGEETKGIGGLEGKTGVGKREGSNGWSIGWGGMEEGEREGERRHMSFKSF